MLAEMFDTFLQAFLAFGSISKRLHCTKSYSLLPDPGHAWVDQLKRAMRLHNLSHN